MTKKAKNSAPAASPDMTTPDTLPAEYTDPRELAAHNLIYRLERAATKGHGMDQDRELHKESAALLRQAIGLAPDDELIYPGPSSFGPVTDAPPMGHSLPDASDPDAG